MKATGLSRPRAAQLVLPLLLLALPGAGSVSAQGAPAAPAPDPSALRPGDVVRITVWQKPELSGEFQVSADGTLGDPFYMEVHVTDVPFATAVARLRELIGEYEVKPRVLVQPLIRVAVSGEVRKPDLVNAPPGTTVANAVLLAGGPSDNAAASRARLLRDGIESRIDLRHPQTGLAAEAIRSGDQIIIPRKRSILRDVIGPVSSLTGAVISIAYLFTRYF